VVEKTPIRFGAEFPLPVTFWPNWPKQQSHGLFATAELLVRMYLGLWQSTNYWKWLI